MIEQSEQRLTQRMNELRQEIHKASCLALKAMNGSRFIGDFMEYEVIPFVNGNMPPENLPALTNLTAITTLTAAQADDYLRGYGITNLDGLDTEQKKFQKVAELVGVAAEVVRIRVDSW
ncbi:hypothetical protein ONZ45_g2357 [Pleurotus djamor]|nr:hypothetical protein ONZ45_g19500 [Pleurotus djamor]KAJ8520826.1 hypothetical protein ONZ45_g2357 [Pleurotus djamor]